MLLNCGVGKDFWESLGQQGGQTGQSYRKSVQNIHLKDWCSSLSPNILAIWCEELTHWKKNSDAWEEWRQEEKGTTEDELIGWHHEFGHEFEQALGVGDGQGILVCCSPWGCKESDMTERLNWTELKGLRMQVRTCDWIIQSGSALDFILKYETDTTLATNF